MCVHQDFDGTRDIHHPANVLGISDIEGGDGIAKLLAATPLSLALDQVASEHLHRCFYFGIYDVQ